MDLDLMNLKQRMIKTSIEFIQAQRVYFKVTAPNSRASQTELKDAAEEYLKAAEPYDAALQELREYLLRAEPSKDSAGATPCHLTNFAPISTRSTPPR